MSTGGKQRRKPITIRQTPPELVINEDEFFFEVDPPELKNPPSIPLPTIEEIDELIKEEKEERKKGN